MVVQIVLWILLLTIFWLSASYLSHRFFRNLPDAGFCFALPLGLLCYFSFYWIVVTLFPFGHSSMTMICVGAFYCLFALIHLKLRLKQYRVFLNDSRNLIIAATTIFVIVFALGLFIRGHIGFVYHTEQPMDLAFLNALMRSVNFPPHDPWMAGHSINYYYFGYLIFGSLGKFLALNGNVVYNLALPTVAALSAVGIFGITYNLVRLSNVGEKFAYPAGFFAIFLLFAGNLEGVLEYMQSHSLGSSGFWSFVNVGGLSFPELTVGFYPERHWWWFQASRVLPGGEISEFPFFSLILGDLHPHLMSIPFFILGVSLIFNLFCDRSAIVFGRKWFFANKHKLLLFVLVMGGCGFINIADLPVLSLLFAVILYIRLRSIEKEDVIIAFAKSAMTTIGLTVLALVCFFPFYLSFTSNVNGIAMNELPTSRSVHMFLMWGLFILMGTIFFVAYFSKEYGLLLLGYCRNCSLDLKLQWAIVSRHSYLIPTGTKSLSRLLFLILLSFSSASLISLLLFGEFIGSKGGVFILLSGIILWLVFLAPAQFTDAVRRPLVFIVTLILVSLGLILVPELLYINDLFNSRMNTVFKLYYQAWILLSCGIAYTLIYVILAISQTKAISKYLHIAYVIPIILLIIPTIYYPLAASLSRIEYERTSQWNISALPSSTVDAHDDEDVIRYFNEVDPRLIIVESVGNDYSSYGRIASFTGLATLISWPGHQQQWNRSSDEISRRITDVETIYKDPDVGKIKHLIDLYGFDFIVVGDREYQKYGKLDLGRFEKLAINCNDNQSDKACYRNGSTVIYRVK